MRDCHPAPVALKYSTTSGERRMAIGTLVVSAFGRPGLRTTFAAEKKAATCAESLGSYRSVSGSYATGTSDAASRFTRSQSVCEVFFKPGMIGLPLIFMSSAKADNSLFFTRQPDNRQHSQHLGDIRKCLAPDFSITDHFKYQAITIGQDKPSIDKVELMFFKVYPPFRFIPYHNYCIYGNGEDVNPKTEVYERSVMPQIKGRKTRSGNSMRIFLPLFVC